MATCCRRLLACCLIASSNYIIDTIGLTTNWLKPWSQYQRMVFCYYHSRLHGWCGIGPENSSGQITLINIYLPGWAAYSKCVCSVWITSQRGQHPKVSEYPSSSTTYKTRFVAPFNSNITLPPFYSVRYSFLNHNLTFHSFKMSTAAKTNASNGGSTSQCTEPQIK